MSYSRKKGATLIEVIVYIAISTMVVAISTKVLIDTRYVYYNFSKKNKKLNIMEDFFINLDNVVKGRNNIKLELKNDKLDIYYIDESDKMYLKEIFFDEDRIIVRYYTDEVTTNVLLDKVDNFNFMKRGKLFFISIEKDEEEYLVCL